MKARGVGTKLRPKASTSVSMGDSWWEKRFLMALFLKLVWSSWIDPSLDVSEISRCACLWEEFLE